MTTEVTTQYYNFSSGDNSSYTNSTVLPGNLTESNTTKYQHILKIKWEIINISLLCLIYLMGWGNFFIIGFYLKVKKAKIPLNALVACLAVGDIIRCQFTLPWELVEILTDFKMNVNLIYYCKVKIFFRTSSFGFSLYTITAIAVIRAFIAFKSVPFNISFRAIKFILSLEIVLLIPLVWCGITKHSTTFRICVQNINKDDVSNLAKYFLLVTTLFCFILVLSSHICMLISLYKQSSNNQLSHFFIMSKKITVSIAVILILSYLLPYLGAITLIYPDIKRDHRIFHILSLCNTFAYIDSGFNSVVYFAFNHQFRIFVKQSLARLMCKLRIVSDCSDQSNSAEQNLNIVSASMIVEDYSADHRDIHPTSMPHPATSVTKKNSGILSQRSSPYGTNLEVPASHHQSRIHRHSKSTQDNHEEIVRNSPSNQRSNRLIPRSPTIESDYELSVLSS